MKNRLKAHRVIVCDYVALSITEWTYNSYRHTLR